MIILVIHTNSLLLNDTERATLLLIKNLLNIITNYCSDSCSDELIVINLKTIVYPKTARYK